MPISAEHVGRRYPAAPPYVVSHAKIAEFAEAVRDDNPAYFGDDPIAPPTFAAVIAAQAWGALFGDEELGLALNRTMHTDQNFTFHRPLRPGDAVVAELSIEKVRNRGNLEMVTVLVDLLVDGESVCEARSTLMHTRPEEAGDE
ncbi:MAG: MaoC family dehydratase N-terminal domain-containing protein [Propionibacteriaceae bacterium]|nr:MaoC family dehydratase N-terminal domain-containing protein [Propionibacteriaceae bacterium]